MKAPLKIKLIALSTAKRKPERAFTNTLTAHLKVGEAKEIDTHNRSRWQEII